MKECSRKKIQTYQKIFIKLLNTGAEVNDDGTDSSLDTEKEKDAKNAALLMCADDVLVIHESPEERAELDADTQQSDLSPESADLIEELDRQLRDYDDAEKPKSKGNTETSLNFLGSKLFYNGRTREEEVKPAAKGNCEVACITPMETHNDENTNDYGLDQSI